MLLRHQMPELRLKGYLTAIVSATKDRVEIPKYLEISQFSGSTRYRSRSRFLTFLVILNFFRPLSQVILNPLSNRSQFAFRDCDRGSRLPVAKIDHSHGPKISSNSTSSGKMESSFRWPCRQRVRRTKELSKSSKLSVVHSHVPSAENYLYPVNR